MILITTKKGGSISSSSLAVTTGSHRDRSLSFTTSGRLDSLRLSYFLDAKRELSDGYTANSRLKKNNYNGKLSYDINDKSSITVLGQYTIKYNQIPNRINPATGEILTLDNSSSISKTGIFRNLHDFEYDPWINKYTALVYNRKISDNNDLNVKWYRTNEYSLIRGFGNIATNGWSSNQPAWVHEKINGWVRGLEVQDTYRTSRANTIIVGHARESRSFDDWSDAVASYSVDATGKKTYFQGTDCAVYEDKSHSLYLQDNLNVSRKLAVSLGIRHDNIREDSHTILWNDAFWGGTTQYQHAGKGSPTKPEASFSYKMTGRTTLHGAFSETYRWPNPTESLHPGGEYGAVGTRYELNYNPITGQSYGDNSYGWYLWPDGTWHYPTPSLEVLPEEAINREIGLAHDFPFGLKLDFTYYYKNIKNMIKGQQAVLYQAYGDCLYYNIPYVQMHGFEVEGSYPVGRQVKGFLSYSYTNAWDPNTWRQVSDTPYRKYSFGFIYTGHNGLNAYLSLNYLGPYYSEYTTGNGNGNGDRVSSEWGNQIIEPWTVPAHKTVDFKISKEKDNREYYVLITNLLDKKYYQGCYLLAPGRYVEIGGTVRF